MGRDTLFGYKGSDKPIYPLLRRKPFKALDKKNMLLIEVQVKIRSLEVQLEVARQKKRKTVKLNPNSRFAIIGDI